MTTLNRRYPAIQGEYEDEQEDEWEVEGESEWEMEGESEWEDEAEFEFEFEAEAEAEWEDEAELESEFEAELEDEAEGFANPVRRIYRDAELMAHLANRAALTESEAEAEAFVGALVPIAARLIPRAARLVQGNAPALVRSATRLVRRLRRDPATRRLVNAVPVVLQRTAQSLADQAAAGRPIDAAAVVRTLGSMTGRVLRGGNARRAMRAVDVFNRRYHCRRRWMQRRSGPLGGYGRYARRGGYATVPAYRRRGYARPGYDSRPGTGRHPSAARRYRRVRAR